MKNTESWANDILYWHDDIAANPTAFIGVRDAHRDAAALVRQLQAELQDARRAGFELLEALKMARDGLSGLPHSLGYEFTHLPKIDAAIGRAQSMAEAQGSGEVEYEFEVWQNGSLQASGSTPDYPTAKSEADHYAAMYGQEGGPVEVRLFTKRQITSPPSVPVEGEGIMVNTPYDVFTLPLQPSGLLSGPRYVVHVPGPEQPAAVDCRCIDCGGNQPVHDATCSYMHELHGEQPAAVDGAKETDIIERLRIESRREPHEPIWRDAFDEIEALRSRLEGLVRNDLNEQCRAWRLAEALREATDLLLSDYPEAAKRLRAALHPRHVESIKG